MHFPVLQQIRVKRMDRTLTVGAASGSLSAIGFRLISELLRSEPTLVIPDCPLCPSCPDLPELPSLEQLNFYSVVLGILIGVSIGPVLDLLYLARQSWRVWLRTRLSELAARNSEALYRLA